MFNKELQDYLQHSCGEIPQYLQDLYRETHVKTLYPRMCTDHFQGRVLSMISHMVRPRRILEIGTFTAYSTLCLAEGLTEDGKIISIDINPELDFLIKKYVEAAQMEEKVDIRYGRALEIVSSLSETFDLVFIDADKQNYLKYYTDIFPKLQPGGYLLADNVLWYGKVWDKSQHDKETTGIRNFNIFVQNDPRVQKVLLPVNDGIMLVRKL